MTKYWDGVLNPKTGKIVSIRYDQKKNAYEAVIRKQNVENGIKKGYLESCGVSAFCCLMEALGYLGYHNYSYINGKMIQPDDWVMSYLNDPHNDYIFSSGDVMDNRAVYNYPKLAKELFNCKAIVLTKFTWNEIRSYINNGYGCQLLLKEPGHYVAAGNYIKAEDKILYMDSWGTRKGLKNNGENEAMYRMEFESNLKPYIVLYSPKG